jgi:hypothetical protein
MNTFRKITTFQELIDANVQFLEGKIHRTPYHCAPVDDETLPMIDDLVKLNKLGCITITSQPAVDETYYKNQKWLQLQQKSFLEGYMPISVLCPFIQFMSTYDQEYSYKIYTIKKISGIKKWLYKLFNLSDIQVKLYLEHSKCVHENLTRERRTEFGQNKITKFTWINYTNIHQDSNMPYDFEGLPNIEPIVVEKMIKFFIYSNEYNKGCVEKLLLKFFKNLQ